MFNLFNKDKKRYAKANRVKPNDKIRVQNIVAVIHNIWIGEEITFELWYHSYNGGRGSYMGTLTVPKNTKLELYEN